MTPRDYIKWRCPHCNGYPAVREARRDKITESLHSPNPVKPDKIDYLSVSEVSNIIAEKEPVTIAV